MSVRLSVRMRGRALAVVAATGLGVTASDRERIRRRPRRRPLTPVAASTRSASPTSTWCVGGVPGLGLGSPPAITVSQSGQRVPTTSTWLLSDSQPLAVVVDATPADLSDAQGIVAELVQELPPGVPLSLVSGTSDQTSAPSLNRDTFMAALGREKAASDRSITSGATVAAAAGIQHVFVVTMCASPAPAAAPIGVIVDVLGVGPGCTGRVALGLGAGCWSVRHRAQRPRCPGCARRHGRPVAVLGGHRRPGLDPPTARHRPRRRSG